MSFLQTAFSQPSATGVFSLAPLPGRNDLFFRCVFPLLALSRHSLLHCKCLLLGVQRTSAPTNFVEDFRFCTKDEKATFCDQYHNQYVA